MGRNENVSEGIKVGVSVLVRGECMEESRE